MIIANRKLSLVHEGKISGKNVDCIKDFPQQFLKINTAAGIINLGQVVLLQPHKIAECNRRSG